MKDAKDIFYTTDGIVEDGIDGNSVASVIDTSILDFDEMNETKNSQDLFHVRKHTWHLFKKNLSFMLG